LLFLIKYQWNLVHMFSLRYSIKSYQVYWPNQPKRRLIEIFQKTTKTWITFERLEISAWFLVYTLVMLIRFTARNFFEIGWCQPAQPAYQPKTYKNGYSTRLKQLGTGREAISPKRLWGIEKKFTTICTKGSSVLFKVFKHFWKKKIFLIKNFFFVFFNFL
jgi:hypothetical protein